MSKAIIFAALLLTTPAWADDVQSNTGGPYVGEDLRIDLPPALQLTPDGNYLRAALSPEREAQLDRIERMLCALKPPELTCTKVRDSNGNETGTMCWGGSSSDFRYLLSPEAFEGCPP